MSSGTKFNPRGVRKMIGGLMDKIMTNEASQRNDPRSGNAAVDLDRIARLGMTPRQQILNHFFGWYRCEHYSARRIDWMGREVLDPIEHEAIASSGSIPPGFIEMGKQYPIKFRRPSAPYSLVKVIVDRFTAMLFSERQHPHVYVEGDEDTDEYVTALVETGRLWPSMILARQYGGSMGTVCVGFQFLDGKPVIEVHDPRWIHPSFKDRSAHQLEKIEKRYMYPVDERDYSGRFQTVWYWYRRVIDEDNDILFKPAKVGRGDEPEWEIDRQVIHGFGFCPVVWVQNMPVQEDIDGDPDCLGIFDIVESIDCLLAEANKGISQNCDPTLRISTDMEMSEVRKGSDNAIKLPTGGSADYIEISGTGPDAALKLVEVFRKYALEVAQCVLEHPEMSQRTATEIERLYSTMIAKADILREQYGQRCIIPLVEMMVAAAQKMRQGFIDPMTGGMVKFSITLPPRIIHNLDGSIERMPQKLGTGGVIGIKWPRYFQTTLADIEFASRSAIEAKTGGLIDMEHAIKFVAEYFGVDDVARLIAKLQQMENKRQNAMEQQAMGYMSQESGVPSGLIEAEPETPVEEEV